MSLEIVSDGVVSLSAAAESIVERAGRQVLVCFASIALFWGIDVIGFIF
jgi:hypothetical protein